MRYPLLALAVIFLSAGVALAVDTTAIDALRTKTAFTDADGAVIDQFVGSAVRELLDRTEFGNVGVTTDTFVREMNPAAPNAKYSDYFAAAVLKHFRAGLAEADKITDVERRKDIKLNLLIMLEKVGQLRTAVLAEDSFADPGAGVRYWAVKCVTNPAVLTQLNSGSPESTRAAGEIATRLKAAVAGEANPATLALMADFGGGVTAPEAAELLVAVANKRIKAYEDWTVTDAIIDGRVLEALGKKVKTSKPAATAYGQLLSCCMQRYGKYMATPSVMGEQEAIYLGTTLAMVEKGSLIALLGPGRQSIQAAVAKGGSQGASAMNGEYALLFGSNGAAGELTKVLGVKYPDAQGKEQVMPRQLPEKTAAPKK
jgi:hypothetical protein